MVLFINVCMGQKVEVFWGRGVFRGTVQFKGSLATKRGDWVGVSLDKPSESYSVSVSLSVGLKVMEMKAVEGGGGVSRL